MRKVTRQKKQFVGEEQFIMSRMTAGRDKTMMDTQRTNFLKEVYTKEEQYVEDIYIEIWHCHLLVDC